MDNTDDLDLYACDECGQDVLARQILYADGDLVACPECGQRYQVSCDSETPITLEAIEEGITR